MAQDAMDDMAAVIEKRIQVLQQELAQSEANCDLTKGRIESAQEQLQELEKVKRSLRGAVIELSQLHTTLYGAPVEVVGPTEIDKDLMEEVTDDEQ